MQKPDAIKAAPLALGQEELGAVTGGQGTAAADPGPAEASSDAVLSGFFHFDQTFRGGVVVAAADAEGDGA